MLINIIVLIVGLAFFEIKSSAVETMEYPLLIQNVTNGAALPRQFRMSSQELPTSPDSSTSLLGLSHLNASASGQFSEAGLQKILHELPSTHVTIVDLREESHGFLNGEAVSWYAFRNWANQGFTQTIIEHDEGSRLAALSQKETVTIQTKTPPRMLFEVQVKSVLSESDVAGRAGTAYIRLPVTDHIKPDDNTVDKFIAIVSQMPRDEWIHFHCCAGKGRASTFFVMYDMLRNAKSVSFEDIIKRQELLGGKNLSKLPQSSEWKYPYAVEKLEFLKQFYHYCRDGNPFEQKWTDWLKK